MGRGEAPPTFRQGSERASDAPRLGRIRQLTGSGWIGQNRRAEIQQAKADHDFVEQELELKTDTEPHQRHPRHDHRAVPQTHLRCGTRIGIASAPSSARRALGPRRPTAPVPSEAECSTASEPLSRSAGKNELTRISPLIGCPTTLRSAPMSGDQIAVPRIGRLRRAPLCLEVDVDQAEALMVALSPSNTLSS